MQISRSSIAPSIFSSIMPFIFGLIFFSAPRTPQPGNKFQKKADFQIQAPADTTSPMVKEGKKLASQNACTTCHSTDGSQGTGPTWKGLYGKTQHFSDGTSTKVDSAYIRQSILDPQAKIVKNYMPVMPSYKGQLNKHQIDALIAYIKSLK